MNGAANQEEAQEALWGRTGGAPGEEGPEEGGLFSEWLSRSLLLVWCYVG